MLHRLKMIYSEILSREMMAPTFIGIFINPFYIIRRGLYKAILLNKGHLKGKLLDFGCGGKPYKALFDVQEYIGLDIKESGHPIKHKEIDVYYDGKVIPFQDDRFDSIFSSEVFEHIFNLEEILTELHRVLKPGGHMLITLPFVWDEHEIPYDFARYTSFGISHLLKKNGFEVIAVEKTTTYVETVFQMWNAYVWSTYKIRFLGVFKTPLLIAPITIIGILLSKVLRGNRNFYHNNVVIAKKPISSI